MRPDRRQNAGPEVSEAGCQWPKFILALALVAICSGGCSTPYTRRLEQLDQAYQRGDLSRDDYMRFVHDAERWETR